MRRFIIAAIVCLAFAVFGVHTGNAAEPIKNCGNSNPMFIDVGDIIDCQIDNIGGSQNFYFDAFDGDTIRITLVDKTSGTPFPYLKLYDPDGVLISHWNVNDGGRHVDYSLSKTGRYTIVISEWGDDDEVEFRIALQGIVPSPSEARSLNPNSQLDSDIDPFADSDVFFFNGKIGDTIRITLVDKTSGTPFPYLKLYDPDGVLISHWNVNDGGRHVDYSLSKTGRYTIVISEWGDDDEVTYLLSFNCILGKCFDCPICKPFEDVCRDNWAYYYIKAIYDEGITTGCSQNPLKYCPKDDVTREQMAAFIVRAIEGEPPANHCDSGSPFPDVPPSSFFCKYIKRLYELGITTGYGDGTYRPKNIVTREQMAAFLARAFLDMD